MVVSLNDVYERLFEAFGPQSWWPAESRLEILVGAVLTQNTSWTNVERAIAQLRDADLLDLHRLHSLPAEELAELIRQAGPHRVKARRLQNLLSYVVEAHAGSLDAMFACKMDQLRRELLSINGIGPETADSILLYAGEMPTFVVDAYTARILKRHAWIEPEAGYYDIQQYFTEQLPAEPPLYNEFHALLVELAKRHCRVRPKCEGCPLECLLPESGVQPLT